MYFSAHLKNEFVMASEKRNVINSHRDHLVELDKVPCKSVFLFFDIIEKTSNIRKN